MEEQKGQHLQFLWHQLNESGDQRLEFNKCFVTDLSMWYIYIYIRLNVNESSFNNCNFTYFCFNTPKMQIVKLLTHIWLNMPQRNNTVDEETQNETENSYDITQCLLLCFLRLFLRRTGVGDCREHSPISNPSLLLNWLLCRPNGWRSR